MAASARSIRPSQDPDLLTVAGNIAEQATADRLIAEHWNGSAASTPWSTTRVYLSKPFTDYTAADYAAVTMVNLTGFFRLTQRAIAEMAIRYGGHIVSVLVTATPITESGPPAALSH